MEAVLRKQRVEVVAGDASRNFGKSLADKGRILIADPGEPGIDLGGTSSGGDDTRKIIIGGCANGHAGSVVEKDVERPDIVDGFATHERVGTTGVVSDHAANGAAGMGCRVGSEGEVMLFSCFTHAVENDAGLNACELLIKIDRMNGAHVLGKVEHNGDIAALASEAGTCAAQKNGSAELAADCDGRFGVGGIAGDDDSDRNLTVVRSICGVKSERA